jgi:hypothetical protein
MMSAALALQLELHFINSNIWEKLFMKEVDFMDSKITIVPDSETVKPPIVPTIPAPVPIPMPHPQQVKKGHHGKKSKDK